MTYEILRLESRHVPDIAELEELCFSDPYSKKTLETSVDSQRDVSFVCICADKAVGYAEFGDFIDTLSVNRIATHPDHRKKGIARSLLNKAVETAKCKNIGELSLEVRASNSAARSLYESFGFSLIGKRPNYYRNPKEDAAIYIMKL
ncbi:MAG: ribosomal protein S18-alanine N-acetyltransferase [Clostridia bacterium]|nr:ribosomal protein S18-alanine N-acetyltransferase [Clostridia bacterium]